MKKISVPSTLSITPQAALESAILELKDIEARRLELSAILASSNSYIEELSIQLEESRVESRERAAEIQAIRSSLAWKITGPLRNLSKNHEWIGKGLQIVRNINSKKEKWKGEDNRFSGLDGTRLEQVVEAAEAQVGSIPRSENCLNLRDSRAISIPFPWHEPSLIKATRVVALVRVKRIDAVGDFRRYLELVQEPVDLHIFATSQIPGHVLESAFGQWMRGTVDIEVLDDSRYSFHSPLKTLLGRQLSHQYMLYLCDDQEIAGETLEPWRQFMLESAIGNGDSASSILALMDSAPEIGVVGVKHFEPVKSRLSSHEQLQRCQQLVITAGFGEEPMTAIDFLSGGVFWARPAALMLLDAALNRPEFDQGLPGQGESDLESEAIKLVFFACENAGYQWLNVANPDYYHDTSRIHEVASKSVLRQQIALCAVPLSSQDDICTRAEVGEVVTRATDALVRDIQRNFLGSGPRNLIKQPSVESMALGFFGQESPRRNFRTALRAASIALSRYGTTCIGRIYLEVEPDFLRLEPFAASLVETFEVGPEINHVAFHNRLMSHAFADGATHYICASSLSVLHPNAIQGLVEMMEANNDRALVSCLDFPIQSEKQYSVYSFDTDRLSNGCWMISRAGFNVLGELDEELCEPIATLDFSWRARATGLLLKTSPKALCLNAVANRQFGNIEKREIFVSTMRLSRKWGASTEFNEWFSKRASLWEMDVSSFPAREVPWAWKSQADFDSHRARAHFSHLLDD